MIRHIVFDYAVFVLPLVLLILSWIWVLRARNSEASTRVPWTPLVIATASDAYFWLSLSFPDLFLGPNFSNVRNDVVSANVLVALVIAVFLCFRARIARWRLFAASLSLALQ